MARWDRTLVMMHSRVQIRASRRDQYFGLRVPQAGSGNTGSQFMHKVLPRCTSQWPSRLRPAPAAHLQFPEQTLCLLQLGQDILVLQQHSSPGSQPGNSFWRQAIGCEARAAAAALPLCNPAGGIALVLPLLPAR